MCLIICNMLITANNREMNDSGNRHDSTHDVQHSHSDGLAQDNALDAVEPVVHSHVAPADNGNATGNETTCLLELL